MATAMARRMSTRMRRRLLPFQVSRMLSSSSQQSLVVATAEEEGPPLQQLEASGCRNNELLASKCDYVKALYGFGSHAVLASDGMGSVSEYRNKQAATTALQNYLHFRKGVPLDDAVFISGNAPCYVDSLLRRLGEYGGSSQAALTGSYEQVRTLLETMIQKEGIDEMEAFLESIGVPPGQYAEVALGVTQGNLCGDHGLLRTAKALEALGIPKRTFWSLLSFNKQLLNYTLRDCTDTVGILQALGVGREQIGRALQQCPSAFKVELEEEMRPVVQQLERIGLDRVAVGQIILEAPTKFHMLGEINMEALVTAIQELGLSKEETTSILQQNPVIIVGTTINKLVQLVKYLKSSLLLEDEEVVALVSKYPRILVLNLERSIVGKVDYLKQMGVRRVFIKSIIMQTPHVLSYSLSDNLQPKVAFLESIGFERANLGTLLARSPCVLSDIVSSDLRRKANFLLANGVKARDLGDLFYTYPEFMRLRLEQEVRPTLEYLKKLGADTRTVGHMIAKHPFLIGYDLDGKVKPVVEYLRSIGLRQEEVVLLVAQRPSILGASVDGCLVDKVKYFEGLGFQKGSAAFARALGYCFAIPISFMNGRLDRLRKLGFSDAQASTLVNAQVWLLYRDEERSLKTIDYLVNTMQVPVDHFLKFPHFLRYDLETRIKPRHRLIAWLKSKNIVRRDYPVAYLHMHITKFEDTFADCHPQARDVYHGRLPAVTQQQQQQQRLLAA